MRARNIAETEATRAYAQAALRAYAASQVVTGFVFKTANDEIVCDVCGPLAGKRFDLDDTEHVPPLHPRCRCWASPEV